MKSLSKFAKLKLFIIYDDPGKYLMKSKVGSHSRRIYTEDKAKVVAAVWGTYFIQFLAALAIFHQDYLKKL